MKFVRWALMLVRGQRFLKFGFLPMRGQIALNCSRLLMRRQSEGQTMTEYALILSAVAVVVFVTYQIMGQDINSLVNKLDKSLTST
jgi:Flp pilus assembly pilin Flp